MKPLLIAMVVLGCLTVPLLAQGPPAASLEQQMMEAAYLGKVEVVKQLVLKGATVDAADPEKRTSLMWAAFNGHTAVVEYLLDREAHFDAKDSSGRTALMYASSGPFAETVELLLKKGAEVDIQGTLEGFTALMTASAEGQLEVVRLLLDYGADVDLKDKDEDTALSFAQENGHSEVVALLQNPPPASKLP